MKGKGKLTVRQPATKFPQQQKKMQQQLTKISRNTSQFRGGRSGSK